MKQSLPVKKPWIFDLKCGAHGHYYFCNFTMFFFYHLPISSRFLITGISRESQNMLWLIHFCFFSITAKLIWKLWLMQILYWIFVIHNMYLFFDEASFEILSWLMALLVISKLFFSYFCLKFNYRKIAIIGRSWIQAIHKAKGHST